MNFIWKEKKILPRWLWKGNAVSFQSEQGPAVQFSSFTQSRLTLWPHGLQHARPPCPSPTPGVYSNPCPSSQWCHPTISSLLSPSPHTFNLTQHQGLFQSVLHIRRPKYWSSSFNIGPSNEYSGLISFRMCWIGSPCSPRGLSRVFSNTTVQKHQVFGAQLSSQSNSHPYMTTGKTIALTRWTFVGKVMSLLLNMLSRLS